MDEEVSKSQANRIRKKSTWFYGTTHLIDDIEHIKENISEFPFFAYIIHDKDLDTSLHIHFVFQVNGSRSIKSVCDTLECAYQDVRDTNRPKHEIKYLIHNDSPEKHQYSIDELITNNIDRVQYLLSDITHPVSDIFKDFQKLRSHLISPDEFLDLYSNEIGQLPFYQKIKTMEVIYKMY